MTAPAMRQPALFVSHGSPMIAIEDDPWSRALAAFAARLPRPRAVVVVSGHFESSGPVRVTASPAPETLHDYHGFPEELSKIRYPAKGDPGLAAHCLTESANRFSWVDIRALAPALADWAASYPAT